MSFLSSLIPAWTIKKGNAVLRSVYQSGLIVAIDPKKSRLEKGVIQCFPASIRLMLSQVLIIHKNNLNLSPVFLLGVNNDFCTKLYTNAKCFI